MSLSIRSDLGSGLKRDPEDSNGNNNEDSSDDDISYLPNPKDTSGVPKPKVLVKDESSSSVKSEMGFKLESGLLGNDEEAMEQMGLPSSFTFGAPNSRGGGGGGGLPQATRKGEKKNVYNCDICQVELNSEETLLSHVNGAKHLKKKKVMQDKQMLPKEVISLVDQPAPAPKKIPVKLSEKLRESSDDVVGLAYLSETIACSSAEAEPYYECYLCGNTGEANGMFNHVYGKGHREKFLQKKYPLDPQYVDISKDRLLREVKRHSENDRLDLINTVYSDELYPWTASKAPWSMTKGGTGTTPSGIQEAKERRRNKIMGLLGDDENGKVKHSVGSVKLIDPRAVKDVKDSKELMHYYEVVTSLLEKIGNFHQQQCVDGRKQEVEVLSSMATSNLIAMSCIQLKPDASKSSNTIDLSSLPSAAAVPSTSGYPNSSSSTSSGLQARLTQNHQANNAPQPPVKRERGPSTPPLAYQTPRERSPVCRRMSRDRSRERSNEREQRRLARDPRRKENHGGGWGGKRERDDYSSYGGGYEKSRRYDNHYDSNSRYDDGYRDRDRDNRYRDRRY